MNKNFVTSEDITNKLKTFRSLSKPPIVLNITTPSDIGQNGNFETVIKENNNTIDENMFMLLRRENELLKRELESIKIEMLSLHGKFQDCVTYKEFDSEMARFEVDNSLSESTSYPIIVSNQKIIKTNNKYSYLVEKRNDINDIYKVVGVFTNQREIVKTLKISKGTVGNICNGKRTRVSDLIRITKT